MDLNAGVMYAAMRMVPYLGYLVKSAMKEEEKAVKEKELEAIRSAQLETLFKHEKVEIHD
jgi:hypothetical protein